MRLAIWIWEYVYIYIYRERERENLYHWNSCEFLLSFGTPAEFAQAPPSSHPVMDWSSWRISTSQHSNVLSELHGNLRDGRRLEVRKAMAGRDKGKFQVQVGQYLSIDVPRIEHFSRWQIFQIHPSTKSDSLQFTALQILSQEPPSQRTLDTNDGTLKTFQTFLWRAQHILPAKS